MSVNISASYVQDQKHSKVSERFNVIQAASVGQAMSAQGLQLVSLSTGKGRQVDKVDFQRTLSRYRGPEIAPGVFLDIVYDSKHMGRGVDRLYVGIFRMVCTNGLFTGTAFFCHEIRHSGDTYETLQEGIAAALGCQEKLAEVIARMQATVLTAEQVEELRFAAAKLIVGDDVTEFRHRLGKTNRESDQSQDLWTQYNLAQENGVKGNNVAYVRRGENEHGLATVRNMTARPIKPNSAKDLEFNQGLWSVAEKLAA